MEIHVSTGHETSKVTSVNWQWRWWTAAAPCSLYIIATTTLLSLFYPNFVSTMGTCTATAQVLLLPARLAAHTPQLHHNNIIPTAIVPPEPEGFWLSSRTAQVSRKSNWCPSLDGSASDSGQDSPVLCLSNLRSKVEGWSLPHDELDKTNLDCVQWPREDISVMSFHAWPRWVQIHLGAIKVC